MNEAIQLSRQAWLEASVTLATHEFEKHGYSVPQVRISCGFPSTGQRSNRIGECWPTKVCSGGINEIFISPFIDDSDEVIGIIFHELAHAVDDCKSGHGAAFKKIANTIGLTGKMIHAHPNDDLGQVVRLIVAALGAYPHKKLISKPRLTTKKKRPYALCSECGFSVPMLKKFLDVGPPICPKDEIMMTPEGQWD